MSTPKAADPAKLVMSCLISDRALLEEIYPLLEDIGGPVDMISAWLDFDYTQYYEKEMGPKLHRKVFVFKSLIRQADLSAIKLATNAVEKQFSKGQQRMVNIDPGYLLRSRFILATGKDYSHRICIGNDIYADLTLMYGKQEGFITLPWTYPDYAGSAVQQFLLKVREKYVLDLKSDKGSFT